MAAITIAEAERLFLDFEKKATARLRAAQRHGFDTSKIEALNEEGRQALFRKVLDSRVGRLQALLDDLNVGTL